MVKPQEVKLEDLIEEPLALSTHRDVKIKNIKNKTKHVKSNDFVCL